MGDAGLVPMDGTRAHRRLLPRCRLREIIPPRERANGAKLVYPTSTTDEYWFSNVRPQGREFWTRVAWPSVEKAIVEAPPAERPEIDRDRPRSRLEGDCRGAASLARAL